MNDLTFEAINQLGANSTYTWRFTSTPTHVHNFTATHTNPLMTAEQTPYKVESITALLSEAIKIGAEQVRGLKCEQQK